MFFSNSLFPRFESANSFRKIYFLTTKKALAIEELRNVLKKQQAFFYPFWIVGM